MPKLVDHNQRRMELAEAAWRVMRDHGISGVTVRGVAAEAGWSTGSLRHYFANQHELQEYVVRAATETLRRRVMIRIQLPRTQTSVIERIASIVEEMLPLDPNRKEEYALWSAIVEWERRYPPEGGSETWRDQRGLYRQCVAALRTYETTRDPAQATLPHPDSEVELGAALLHTFVDGLASQLTNTPKEVSVADVRHLLRAFLRTLYVS